MKVQLKQELQDTMYIHSPLPLHKNKSLEHGYPFKTICAKKTIWGEEQSVCQPSVNNLSELEIDKKEGILRLIAYHRTDCWPDGGEENGNYSNFGSAEILFEIPREDWSGYNRIHFQVRPTVKGARNLYINAAVRNEGSIPIPDPYMREGNCMFTPDNREWNDCYWEFDAMPRDCITQLKLYVNLTGQETCMDDHMIYEFRNICLEQAENPEKEKGWECAKDRIVFSTAGYFTDGEKKAIIFNTGMTTFTLRTVDDENIVYRGKIESVSNEKGSFGILDFSDFCTEGEYQISAGNLISADDLISEVFPIGGDILEEPMWKALNFIYCERCGTPVPEKHQACHMDMIARHNGLELNFSGGWHDAGDMSQQAVQTGEVVQALCEAAIHLQTESILKKRLLEEAQWGLDFILRTRFGDGYRAASAAATRITNGIAGDMDDIMVRVHNHSFENFMFAGIEAYAACAMQETDRELAYGSLRTAKEDYTFAEEEFLQNGVHPANMFEHTYNSGLSQYYAVMSWAASCIYLAGREDKYALLAVKWAEKMMDCQETGSKGCRVKGFFYRDESHKEIVHFNHQSREHQFMQALILLCETQPEHRESNRWKEAMKLYGSYLKELMQHSEPYHMIPSGIYRIDEAQNKESFQYLHITVDYEAEKENYKKQLEQGISVDEEHVIKHFPVWFSFKGNNVILLSQAKAAAMLGRYFQDEELVQIGRDQLYWLWGRNPFAQSMQYGVGSRYCSQYTGFCGETAGEIPVGIETYDNEDIPYWPQNVNATYKEVWMSSVGRFLLLAADYMNEGIER